MNIIEHIQMFREINTLGAIPFKRYLLNINLICLSSFFSSCSDVFSLDGIVWHNVRTTLFYVHVTCIYYNYHLCKYAVYLNAYTFN